MKEAFYFQHDYSARNDDKLLEIRGKYGNEGYAVYFYCLETMAERGDGYILASLLGGLSLGYGVANGWLSEFLEFCAKIEVFGHDDKGYYSPRMVEYINWRNQFKIKGKEGADKRWRNKEKIAPPLAPLMHRIGQDRIGQDKDNYPDIEVLKTSIGSIDGFVLFWEAYPKRVGRAKCLIIWRAKNPPLDQVLKTLEAYKKTKQWQDPQFIPHPATWLNQGRWEDDVTIEQAKSWEEEKWRPQNV